MVPGQRHSQPTAIDFCVFDAVAYFVQYVCACVLCICVAATAAVFIHEVVLCGDDNDNGRLLVLSFCCRQYRLSTTHHVAWRHLWLPVVFI